MGLLDYLQARVRSFGYAFRGVYFLLRDTPHARIHLLATAVVVTLGLSFEVSLVEWALLMLAMGMVWAAEGFNSALETLSDRVSTERHPLAGRAKDLAAGAVLLASVFAAAVGLLIFLPHFF
jgi:diacylglycerol kinase